MFGEPSGKGSGTDGVRDRAPQAGLLDTLVKQERAPGYYLGSRLRSHLLLP